MTAVKISIVCFILRVFPDQKFRRICYGVMTLVACYGIAFVTATALQCWPASYAWTQIDSNSQGTCNDVHLQAWLAAACNIALDLLLLVLPLHNLWMLNMGLKKKLQIMVMFSLGIFVTIISIIRLHSLIKFANSKNVTCKHILPFPPLSRICHHLPVLVLVSVSIRQQGHDISNPHIYTPSSPLHTTPALHSPNLALPYLHTKDPIS